MIFNGIDFHNVEELEPCEHGYRMWRLPKNIRQKLNVNARDISAGYACGVELRFRMIDEKVDIYLCAEAAEEAHVAYIFYGSMQGGWQTSSYVIGKEPTKISVVRPAIIAELEQLTLEEELPFSPEVVRIVLPYGKCCFCGVEGATTTLTEADLPKSTYLAYGSSITHGSLALAMPYTYPFRISQKLKTDYINMGFAGSAHLEPAMAEYIVSRKDWTFASVEMGINMLSDFSIDAFEERVDSFTKILSEDGRTIFATDIFKCLGRDEQKTKAFREVVAKYASERLIYTPGLEILGKSSFISSDFVHPSLEGMETIVSNWYTVMENNLKR